MGDVPQTILVPPQSAAVAAALAKFLSDVLAAQKSGATGITFDMDIVGSALSDLAPALSSVAAVQAEFAAEPIGVVEEFLTVGIQFIRQLTGK